MKSPQSYLLLGNLFLVISCTGYYSCSAQAQDVASVVKERIGPKLLFLHYTISKDSNEVYHAEFINKILADGRLKDDSNTLPISEEGAIECIQFDKNKRVLDRTYSKNPLRPIVEYVNDKGDLEKRQLDLDSAQLAIKLQLKETTTCIRLFVIDESGNASIELITTSIQ